MMGQCFYKIAQMTLFWLLNKEIKLQQKAFPFCMLFYWTVGIRLESIGSSKSLIDYSYLKIFFFLKVLD